jgi:hypothetical protein
VSVKRESGVLFGTRANSRWRPKVPPGDGSWAKKKGKDRDPDLYSLSVSRARSPPSAVSLCVHSLSVTRGSIDVLHFADDTRTHPRADQRVEANSC